VIPKPGSATIFFIFTSSASEANNEGYYFSEVDISLEAGLGAVTINKNIFLYGQSTERLTAIRHSNGVDVWVITKAFGNTIWNVFKVDCNGVNKTPVVSNAGYQPKPDFINITVGCLKASPDGTKIASVNTIDAVWELLKFDASIGIISDGLVFSTVDQPFGIEFSPDSKLIYVGIEVASPMGDIFQYNLASHDFTAIESTRIQITKRTEFVGCLQLGPDNKIYCASEFTSTLAVINTPNSAGLACGYVEKQIDLQGKQVFRGLPVFFPSLITNKNADFTYNIGKNCATVNFSATTALTGNLIWHWDFGDGTTAAGQNVSHTWAGGGSITDTITLTVSMDGSCGEAVAVKKIAITPNLPVADFVNTKACADQLVSFTDKTIIPEGNGSQWYWDFGDGTISNLQHPQKVYTIPGEHTVKLSVQSREGCISDTVLKRISIDAIPVVAFTNTQACINEPIQFTNNTSLSVGTIASYAWNFGDGAVSSLINPTHTYNRNGDFNSTLTVFTGNGCSAVASKSFHMEPVKAFAGNDTTVIAGQPLQLNASGGQSYQWTPPEFLNTADIFNPIAILDKDQQYRLKVITAEGCTGFDDIMIHVVKGFGIYVPNAFAPEGKNKIFQPLMTGISKLYYFSIYNRWGQLIFTTTESGKGWDGSIHGVGQTTGVFVWILKAMDQSGRINDKKGTVVLVK
jgi:PKD repeat protein